MKLIIWHNSTCSTSRKALDFISKKFDDIEIRNYIKEPPSVEEIQKVLEKMEISAESILRKKDKVFKEKFIDKSLSEKEWIQAMSENPSIIERPIIISDKKAWLARPFDEFVETCGI